MAGYHYKLQIVPNQFVSSIGAEESIENYWIGEQPNACMLAALRQLMPIDKSWGETEEYRSEKNYSVIYIWWEESIVRSVQFEFAPVMKGEDVLLIKVLSLCSKNNYKIYSERSRNVISPNRLDLWQDFVSVHPFPIYQRKGLLKFT